MAVDTDYSREELRRAVADRFGDLTQIVATATSSGGTTDHIIDVINVSAASEHFNGRQFICTKSTGSPSNLGQIARITATSDNQGKLTVTPHFASHPVTGDEFDVFNRRGIGFTIAEYNRAINSAIRDAYPLGVIPAVITLTSSFDDDVNTYDIGNNVVEIWKVEWQDDDGDWHAIPKATQTNAYGWRTVPTDASGTGNWDLTITGLPSNTADDQPVRFHGYIQQPELSTDSDKSKLNKEWTVARAAYHLALGAIHRGPEYGQLANQLGREAEALRTRLRVIRNPNSERVVPGT